MPALSFAILMTFWSSKFQGAWRESCWGNASHQLFSTLHDAYQDKFVELFMPSGPEGLETFWAQMSKHPAFENHQLLLEPGCSCQYTWRLCTMHWNRQSVVQRSAGTTLDFSFEQWKQQNKLLLAFHSSSPSLDIFWCVLCAMLTLKPACQLTGF